MRVMKFRKAMNESCVTSAEFPFRKEFYNRHVIKRSCEIADAYLLTFCGNKRTNSETVLTGYGPRVAIFEAHDDAI